MTLGKTVLSQILEGLHSEEVRRCASQYPTPRQMHALSAYDHFAALIFAQLTYRESLHDIEACLNARHNLLYHSGIRGNITRTNLAYANKYCDAQLFATVAAILVRRARKLYAGAKDPLDLDGNISSRLSGDAATLKKMFKVRHFSCILPTISLNENH